MCLSQEEWDEEKEPEGFLLSGKVAAKAKEEANGNGKAHEEPAESSDDDLEIIAEPVDTGDKKRKRPAESDVGLSPRKKQARTAKESSDADMILLD